MSYSALASCLVWCLLTLYHRATTQPSLQEPEVYDVNGESGYRSVRLTWKTPSASNSPQYLIRYCELVFNGRFRCNYVTVNDTDTNDVTESSDGFLLHHVRVENLRLATSYSFEVLPLVNGRFSPNAVARKLKNDFTITTKGYAARTTMCMRDKAEVEVETGPYFGGRITVEDTTDNRCWVTGDPTSSRTIYTLDINHQICGSRGNESVMENMIMVTENPSIITYSSRRFHLICSFGPESFTIKAVVNLPSAQSYNSHLNSLVPTPQRSGRKAEPDKVESETNVRQVLNVQDHRLDEGRAFNSGNEETLTYKVDSRLLESASRSLGSTVDERVTSRSQDVAENRQVNSTHLGDLPELVQVTKFPNSNLLHSSSNHQEYPSNVVKIANKDPPLMHVLLLVAVIASAALTLGIVSWKLRRNFVGSLRFDAGSGDDCSSTVGITAPVQRQLNQNFTIRGHPITGLAGTCRSFR